MNIDHTNDGVASAFRRRYKTAYADWLCSQQFNAGLTLNWNADTNLDSARRDVGSCFFRVDRRLLGTRLHKHRDRRTFGVLFFEHLSTNLHCHGLIRVAPPHLPAFFDLFPADRGGVWSEVCPSGTYALSPMTTPRAAAHYDLKEQHPSSDDRTVLWLDEFHPKD